MALVGVGVLKGNGQENKYRNTRRLKHKKVGMTFQKTEKDESFKNNLYLPINKVTSSN